MYKIIASFAIGIAVGAAYASHSPRAVTESLAAAPSMSDMHASIPRPATDDVSAPTF